MNKLVAFVLLLVSLVSLAAQTSDIDAWLDDPATRSDKTAQDTLLTNDLITVNYGKKDARLAMVMSMILPGAGQFYADKSSLTTYIFPVLELSFIGGMIYFNNRGDDKTDKYEKYANGETITYNSGSMTDDYVGPRYNRNYQNQVQGALRDLNPVDIYDVTYWRLDSNDSQHFYEDIGKYAQYIFGWVDWYYRFATDIEGNYVSTNINWDHVNGTDSPNMIWIGNKPLWGEHTEITIAADTHAASAMRKEYIKLRDDSKSDYANARLFTFGLAANHIFSGLDALRLTRKVNRASITQSVPNLNLYAASHDGTLTPMLGMKWQF